MKEVTETGSLLVSKLLKATCVLLIALIASIGLHKLYGAIYPYSGIQGECWHCGAQTMLIPGGWAAFCPRHTPLFGILRWVMVFAFAVSMLVTTISLWLMMRWIAQWGSRRISLLLVILCVAALLISVVFNRQSAQFSQQYVTAIIILFFVLSAVYVDSIESVFIMAIVAIFLAGLVALIIQFIFWVLLGYMNIVPG